jgi:hypothetical protein
VPIFRVGKKALSRIVPSGSVRQLYLPHLLVTMRIERRSNS